MFVNRKQIQTLADNFVESIKFDKDLASISTHRVNEESEDSNHKRMGRRKRNKGVI